MRFLQVELNNFMSWVGPQKFPLENQGLVCLQGRNGSGKSSIFDAVTWCLFGRTTKPVLVDDVVSHQEGKDCYVKLTVQFKNYGKIVVCRYRKHSQMGNDFVIQLSSGKELLNQEASQWLERVLECDYFRFIQTVFFSQSDRRYFTQLTESQQRKILSDLFNFSIFREGQQRAREQLRDLMAEASEKKGYVLYVKGLYKDSKSRVKTFRKKLDVALQKKQENKERLLERRDELMTESRAVYEQLAETEEMLRDIARWRDRIKELEAELEEVVRSINKVRGKGPSKCPTCGQLLDSSREKAVLEKLYQQKTDITESIKEFKDLLETAANADELSKKASRLQSEYEKIRSEISSIDSDLKVLALDVKHLQKELKSEKKLALRRKRELRNAIDDWKKVQEMLPYLDFWETGFGSKGIELYALSQVLPLFNQKVNQFLKFLPTQRGPLVVNYHLSRGHLVSGIRYAGAQRYAGASGGERRRIDLCVSLALAELSQVRSNILLLDEPFEGIEEGSLENVVDLLRSLNVESVFACTHNSGLVEYFDHVWRISMDAKGKSCVDFS